MPVKIFFCYAHEDEELLNKLKTHLKPLQRQGLVDVWYDRDISAGTEWEQEINQQLNSAQIILLLVSPDFMNSDYCYSIEMQRAIERDERKEAKVIPVILRPVYWQGILGKLQALPTDAKPVTDPDWHNLDRAFYNVAEGIRKAVKQLTTKSSSDSQTRPIQTIVSPSHEIQQTHNEQEKHLPLQSKKRGLSKAGKVALIGVMATSIATIIGAILLLHNTVGISNTSATDILLTAEAFPPSYHDALNSTSTQKILWQSVGTNNSRCFFASDGYHVQIPTIPEAICHESGKSYQDFIISIDMVLNGGNASGSGALLFRDQDLIGKNGAYSFEVNTNGQYNLSILNSPDRTLQGWVTSSAIHRGKNVRNTLQVIASGNLLTFYINGVYLTRITDQTFVFGGISLACFNSGEAIFSNLKIYLLH